MTKLGSIYCLFNTANGKVYVGQTWRSVLERFKGHCSMRGSCIANAIAKHGRGNFVISTLCEIQTQGEMDLAETYFISLFGSLVPNGYNLLAEGRGGLPCAETRAKLSKVWTGRKRGPMPQSQRAKISQAKLGSVPVNKGQRLTNDSTREKLRESHRGKRASPETRLKMSLSKLGKTKSLETRARMSAARKRRERMTKPDIPFDPFPKIHRWNREVIVTEKIDGTNGVIYVDDTGDRCFAGSRTRWISPEDDNFGFARWVNDNHDELLKLGPGSHFGEWWGQGIQRGYGLKEKRFSLFNVSRWADDRPTCCHVVPVLWRGLTESLDVRAVMAVLGETGSVASPGFMRPEGVVVFHAASGGLFKMTLDANDAHKGA